LQPAALAKSCGISRQYLNLILAGSRDGGKYWPAFSAALNVPVEWLAEGLAPPWWADHTRAVAAAVPTIPIPPVPLAPKVDGEAASNDRLLEAMRRMESKIDALMWRMDNKPCAAARPPPIPESWALKKPKKIRAP
jgi:hypothetical protein